jgi:hypothetical protein
MASWNNGIEWTPERATRIADIITEHGVAGRCTTQLRQAIRAKSPVLGQRAEQAYDEAREEGKRVLTDDEYRTFVIDITDALGDAPPEREAIDWIQEWVIQRAHDLNLSPYEIAERTNGAISHDTAKRYMSRRGAMNSFKLQHILTVLGVTGFQTNPTHRPD